MTLLIDNYDSFTYNLAQLVAALGEEVMVVQHDTVSITDIEAMRPDRIIISPGPGRPEDSGISMDVIKHFYMRLPILGVCLGHQCIGQLFGAKIVHAPRVMHGKTSRIEHVQEGLFEGMETPFVAARYHSLVVDACPDNFIITAWTNDSEKVIMAMRHKMYPLYGIQFHPESFMTPYGMQIMRNFLRCK